MKKLLNEREVNEIKQLLNEEQIDFLDEHISQSKRSKWLQMLAVRKGIVIDQNLDLDEIATKVKDWILLDILDAGYGNRTYRCECGNSLRFQYIVHHTGKNKTYKLGSTCFEAYTCLSPEILRDIRNGFYHIDLQRDEILTKYRDGKFFDITQFMDVELPKDIVEQFIVGLPLADVQVKRVLTTYNEYKLHEEERLEHEKYIQWLQSLSEKQREWMKTNLADEDISEIFNKLGYENTEYSIDYLRKARIDEQIIYQLELGFPLTNKQEFKIYARLNQYQKEQRMAEIYSANNEKHSTEAEKGSSYEEIIFLYGEKLRNIKEREHEIKES